MNHDVQDGKQNELGEGRRGVWRMPTLTEYDIIAATEITNCGASSDGLTCQAGGS